MINSILVKMTSLSFLNRYIAPFVKEQEATNEKTTMHDQKYNCILNFLRNTSLETPFSRLLYSVHCLWCCFGMRNNTLSHDHPAQVAKPAMSTCLYFLCLFALQLHGFSCSIASILYHLISTITYNNRSYLTIRLFLVLALSHHVICESISRITPFKFSKINSTTKSSIEQTLLLQTHYPLTCHAYSYTDQHLPTLNSHKLRKQVFHEKDEKLLARFVELRVSVIDYVEIKSFNGHNKSDNINRKSSRHGEIDRKLLTSLSKATLDDKMYYISLNEIVSIPSLSIQNGIGASSSVRRLGIISLDAQHDVKLGWSPLIYNQSLLEEEDSPSSDGDDDDNFDGIWKGSEVVKLVLPKSLCSASNGSTSNTLTGESSTTGFSMELSFQDQFDLQVDSASDKRSILRNCKHQTTRTFMISLFSKIDKRELPIVRGLVHVPDSLWRTNSHKRVRESFVEFILKSPVAETVKIDMNIEKYQNDGMVEENELHAEEEKEQVTKYARRWQSHQLRRYQSRSFYEGYLDNKTFCTPTQTSTVISMSIASNTKRSGGKLDISSLFVFRTITLIRLAVNFFVMASIFIALCGLVLLIIVLGCEDLIEMLEYWTHSNKNIAGLVKVELENLAQWPNNADQICTGEAKLWDQKQPLQTMSSATENIRVRANMEYSPMYERENIIVLAKEKPEQKKSINANIDGEHNMIQPSLLPPSMKRCIITLPDDWYYPTCSKNNKISDDSKGIDLDADDAFSRAIIEQYASCLQQKQRLEQHSDHQEVLQKPLDQPYKWQQQHSKVCTGEKIVQPINHSVPFLSKNVGSPGKKEYSPRISSTKNAHESSQVCATNRTDTQVSQQTQNLSSDVFDHNIATWEVDVSNGDLSDRRRDYARNSCQSVASSTKSLEERSYLLSKQIPCTTDTLLIPPSSKKRALKAMSVDRESSFVVEGTKDTEMAIASKTQDCVASLPQQHGSIVSVHIATSSYSDVAAAKVDFVSPISPGTSAYNQQHIWNKKVGTAPAFVHSNTATDFGLVLDCPEILKLSAQPRQCNKSDGVICVQAGASCAVSSSPILHRSNFLKGDSLNPTSAIVDMNDVNFINSDDVKSKGDYRFEVCFRKSVQNADLSSDMMDQNASKVSKSDEGCRWRRTRESTVEPTSRRELNGTRVHPDNVLDPLLDKRNSNIFTASTTNPATASSPRNDRLDFDFSLVQHSTPEGISPLTEESTLLQQISSEKIERKIAKYSAETLEPTAHSSTQSYVSTLPPDSDCMDEHDSLSILNVSIDNGTSNVDILGPGGGTLEESTPGKISEPNPATSSLDMEKENVFIGVKLFQPNESVCLPQSQHLIRVLCHSGDDLEKTYHCNLEGNDPCKLDSQHLLHSCKSLSKTTCVVAEPIFSNDDDDNSVQYLSSRVIKKDVIPDFVLSYSLLAAANQVKNSVWKYDEANMRQKKQSNHDDKAESSRTFELSKEAVSSDLNQRRRKRESNRSFDSSKHANADDFDPRLATGSSCGNRTKRKAHSKDEKTCKRRRKS